MTMLPLGFAKNQADLDPTLFAEQVGLDFANDSSDDRKKKLGQYFTPASVARFMASLYEVPRQKKIAIVDPGSGAGVLSCALLQRIAECKNSPSEIALTCYEVDETVVPHLENSLTHAKRWLSKKGITLRFVIRQDDFVLVNAAGQAESVDVVISNPPYFKISKDDPRAKAVSDVVHGQPNIYALFMAISARILREGGAMLYITPRSYAAGPYFRVFRKWFLIAMRPVRFHLFHSRDKAFRKDKVLQENIILAAVRDGGWHKRGDTSATISSSEGAQDLSDAAMSQMRLCDLVDLSTSQAVLTLPADVRQVEAVETVRRWQNRISSLGLKVSTGPVVAFRSTRYITNVRKPVPLLWLQNILPMAVRWPLQGIRKPQEIDESAAAKKLLLPNSNYVLVRRFSAKEDDRRLVAAPYLAENGDGLLGLENHINYIYRPNGELTDDEARGLAAILNSRLMDDYFRAFNGNTQVSATEISELPMPDWDVIRRVGAGLARLKGDTVAHADDAITELTVTSDIAYA